MATWQQIKDFNRESERLKSIIKQLQEKIKELEQKLESISRPK